MNLEEANQKLLAASALYKEKKYRAALDILLDLEAEFPNNEHVLFNAALCLGKLGETDEALLYWESVSEKLSPEKSQKLRSSILKYAPRSYPGNDAQTPAPNQPSRFDTLTPEPSRMEQPEKPSGPRPYQPIASLRLDQLPLYLEYDFVRYGSGADDFNSDTFLEQESAITDEGWRVFVQLLEHLVSESAPDKWLTADELTPEKQQEAHTQYENVFQAGELIVAMRQSSGIAMKKRILLFTDRQLYTPSDRGEIGIPWRLIDHVAVLPSKRYKEMGVQLRDGRKIFIDLAGFTDLYEPLYLFLNEVSLIFEKPGGAIAVFPQSGATLNIPQVCANCITDNLGVGGTIELRSEKEPVIGSDGEDDFAEEDRNESWSKRIIHAGVSSAQSAAEWTSAIAKRTPTDDADTDETENPNRFTFRICPFCSNESPVRLVRFNEKANALVFKNQDFARLFARANRCPNVPATNQAE